MSSLLQDREGCCRPATGSKTPSVQSTRTSGKQYTLRSVGGWDGPWLEADTQIIRGVSLAGATQERHGRRREAVLYVASLGVADTKWRVEYSVLVVMQYLRRF